MAAATTASEQVAMAPKSRPRISAKDASFATIIYSDFFRAALTGGFKEAEEKKVTLKDDSPAVFEFFVHWLYHQQLPSATSGNNAELIERWEKEDPEHRLVQVCIFADKYQVKDLERHTNDALFHEVEQSTELPSYDTINLAFRDLNPDSPVCRMLVDLYCYYQRDKPERYHEDDDCDHAFVLKMWQRHRKLGGTCGQSGEVSYSYSLDICDYHDHATDEEKQACKKEQKNARAHKRALADPAEYESKSD